MIFAVRYHPETACDLLRITERLVAYSGPEVAARRIEQITGVARNLASFPHRGADRSDVAQGLRPIMAADQNAVLTAMVDDNAREVLILAVAYGGEDWMSKSHDRLGD